MFLEEHLPCNSFKGNVRAAIKAGEGCIFFTVRPCSAEAVNMELFGDLVVLLESKIHLLL